MKSRFLRINKKDVCRGLGIAAGAALTFIFTQMCTGAVPDAPMMKSAAAVFGGSGGMYILKNLFTNSHDKFGKRERPDEQG